MRFKIGPVTCGLILVLLVGIVGAGLSPAPTSAASPASPDGKAEIGNYVWYDTNFNGTHNAAGDAPAEGEFAGSPQAGGIDGVVVNLYVDNDLDGKIAPGQVPLNTMTTGDNLLTTNVVEHGWYNFTGLNGGLNVQYLVQIAPSNFLPGGALYGLVQTSGGTFGPNPLAVPMEVEKIFVNADFGYAKYPLEVTKTLTNSSPFAVIGDTVTFKITVHNAGIWTLDPVPLNDFYSPACLKYVSAATAAGPFAPTTVDTTLGSLHWDNVGALAPGASVDIYVTFTAQNAAEMAYKEGGWQDYAPKGIPDFDARQVDWDAPKGSGAGWYQEGPAAVADSLWWFDSKFESGSAPPPAIADTYPLVQSFSTTLAWDDHDAKNVAPLINRLSTLMGTTAATGTGIGGLVSGVTQYIAGQGLAASYAVTPQAKPSFAAVADGVRRADDVVLLLGFWQAGLNGAPATRLGGNYVTASGVDVPTARLTVSDPMRNSAESGGAGRALPGPHTSLHPVIGPAGDPVHNDAQNVSQDAYLTAATPVLANTWGPVGYVDANPATGCSQLAAFLGKNDGDYPSAIPATCNPQGGALSVVVEYAVAVAPKSNTLMCSPTTNIAAVSGAKPQGSQAELPPSQAEARVTEGSDLGDLPSPYATLLINSGPRHLIMSPLRLGTQIDSELNGQPTASANGDDVNGVPDDEDGVSITPGYAWKDGAFTGTAGGKGGSLTFVISGGAGVPQVFMDFSAGNTGLQPVTLYKADGSLLLATPTTLLPAGTYPVYFSIPAGTMAPGPAIETRVRVSSAGGLGATGDAADGEVEDNIFAFGPTAVAVRSFAAQPAPTNAAVPAVVALATLALLAGGLSVRRLLP